MSNRIANRVKMTVSGTPGTGTITLGSAVAGFQSFVAAGVSNADTVPYIIEDGAAWEIGVGTYTATGTTMSRSVTASSNSGNPINATSAAIVMISPLAADLQAGTAAGNLVRLDGSARIPAVDGSLVTNLNATQIATGTISASRLPSISLTTGVTGTLPVANGGTGLTSLTAGYIPFGAGTSALGNDSGLFWDNTNKRLGIGTSAPLSLLDLGSGAGNKFYVYSFSPSNLYYGFGIASNEMRMYRASDGVLTFGSISTSDGTTYTENMRIASDGSVGIGTSGPGYKLDCRGEGFFGTTVNSGIRFLNQGGVNYIQSANNGSPANLHLGNWYGGGFAILDASGNLGLGVTPSAWNSAFKALQVGKAAVSALTNSGYFTSNAYYGASGYNYIAADYALLYAQENGKHYWSVAPSGTAGSTISFTQAMTLDASGNLLVGTTSSPSGSNKLRVANAILDDLAIGSGAHFDTSNATSLAVAQSSNAVVIPGKQYYFVFVVEKAVTGAPAMFLLANGAVTKVAGDAMWETGTTPGASKFSIGSDGTDYRIYNGYTSGSGYSFAATILRCW